MATDHSLLRNGIAERLALIADLEVQATAIGHVNPPTAVVGGLLSDGVLDYDATMQRGLDRWELTVRVYTMGGDQDVAQVALDKYIAHSGAFSIKAAVEDDTTAPADILNTADAAVKVFQARDYDGYQIGGAELMGVEFRVEIIVG